MLKRLGANAYLLELLEELSISPIFNIEDLSPYYGDNEEAPSVIPTPRFLEVPKNMDVIEDVLNKQIVSTKNGRYKKFLIKWKGKPISKSTWIIASDFQCCDPELFDRYQPFH